jgi:hypothetical protein
MYTKNELMFPHEAIPHLEEARGEVWQSLINRVAALPQTHEEVLAFMLMMVRINGCMPCETDSYRAMRGCAVCTLQTLRRYKGTDEDLLRLFEQSLEDVRNYLARPGTLVLIDDLAFEVA